MNLDCDNARLDLKRREIEARQAWQLMRIRELIGHENYQRSAVREAAAAFNAVRDGLLSSSRRQAPSAAQLKFVSFELARLKAGKSRLAEASAGLALSRQKRLELGDLLLVQKQRLDRLDQLLKARSAAAEGAREVLEGEEINEQAVLRSKLDDVGWEIGADAGREDSWLESALPRTGPAEDSTCDGLQSCRTGDGLTAPGPASQAFQDCVSQPCQVERERQSLSSGGSPRQPLARSPGWCEGLASQVAQIDSWERSGASALELEFVGAAGRRARLRLRRSVDQIINICLVPEFERDRRALWHDKQKITAALEQAGLRIGRVVVRRGE